MRLSEFPPWWLLWCSNPALLFIANVLVPWLLGIVSLLVCSFLFSLGITSGCRVMRPKVTLSGALRQWLAAVRCKDSGSLPHLRTSLRDQPGPEPITGSAEFSFATTLGFNVPRDFSAFLISLQVYLPVVSCANKSFAWKTWSQNPPLRNLAFDTIWSSADSLKAVTTEPLCVCVSGFMFVFVCSLQALEKVLTNIFKSAQRTHKTWWIFKNSQQ